MVKVIRDTPRFPGGPVEKMVNEIDLPAMFIRGWRRADDKPVDKPADKPAPDMTQVLPAPEAAPESASGLPRTRKPKKSKKR